MRNLVEPVSDVTRPKLMPRKSWSHPPTPEEAQVIPLWEEKYITARTVFERRDDRAKGSYNQNPDPITPAVYLKWLRDATKLYNERNAEYDPSLLERMKVNKATLAGLGFIDGPSRHGEEALTVAPHYWRVKREERGFDGSGQRLHGHHTPHFVSIAGDIEYEKAVSVAIGERTHKWLHKARDPRRAYEKRRQQVDGDFDFVAPHMLARGHTAMEIELAREKAHDLNNDLGLYRGGR
jgi:hypothetical protein